MSERNLARVRVSAIAMRRWDLLDSRFNLGDKFGKKS